MAHRLSRSPDRLSRWVDRHSSESTMSEFTDAELMFLQALAVNEAARMDRLLTLHGNVANRTTWLRRLLLANALIHKFHHMSLEQAKETEDA